MKKNALYGFLLALIVSICLGIMPGCGDDGGSSAADGGADGNGSSESSESTGNNAPTADDMNIILDMDSQVAITLSASDPDGNALVWHINSDPSHGTLAGTAPDLTYYPESGFFGRDSFTFYVDDYAEYSNTATVTILVKSKNILFADTAASGAGDGSSWEDAFNHPQDAMDAASAGEQVWVAQGTYYSPDAADPAIPIIQLKEEVYVYGGFDGTESNLADRDYDNNTTVLDGNYEVYHVVISASYALIDGFTITKGNADGSDFPDYRGGGMYNGYHLYGITVSNCKFTNNQCNQDGAGIYNYYCSPAIVNCTFENNTAILNSSKTNSGGGGIYNWYASPSITGCTFTNNETMEGSGGGNGGGAIHNSNNSSAKIEDCIFTGNSTYDDSGSSGGAIINYGNNGGSPKITGCVFEDNTSYSGGAIFNDGSQAVISDCIFTDNEASDSGGAFYNDTGDSPVIKNCCIYGNTADDGGGIYNYNCSPEIDNCTISGNTASYYGGGLYNYSSSAPEITNCIIWGNSTSLGDDEDDEMTNAVSASPVISHSDINIAGYAGSNGNIQSDPFFMNGPLGNYYLSHIAAGQAVNSPCIDAGGDTAENLGLVEYTTRIDSGFDTGIVDMGYHYEP